MIAVAAMDCGREQLLCKVKRKVVCIQDTIASISKKQQNLHRSAVGVKSEINSAISRQLESLRNREVWILDQVDVILRIQDQLLQEHIVCLMHELGGLQRLLEIAQCHEEVGEGLTEELAQTLARLGLFNLQPIEDTTLNFTADMASLRRAIHDFGEISAKRPRLSQDMDVGMSENKEKNPAFDLSYNPSDWLIRKTTSLPANLSEDDFEIVDDEQSETDIEIVPSISEDVDPPAWPATEPAPTFGHFEELLRSPLEDWLQDCGHNQAEFSEEISYFKEVSQDMKTWLIDNEQKMEEEGEEMQEDEEGEDEEEDMISCPKPVCACTATVEGPQFYEIENLAQLLCIQDATQSQSTSKEKSFNTNMWLARSQEQSKEEKDVDVQEKDEYEKTRPNIAKVCRANELCRDFSECVFDTNCCLNDSAGLSPWLMSNAGTCCEKLHESQGMSDKSTDLDSWLIRGSSRYGISEKQSDWLAVDRETTPAANDFPSPIDGFLRQQSNDIYDWLVSDVKDGGQVSVGKGFESYFEHLSNEPSDWLVQAKQDPTTNLVSPLESYFQQRSENLSDWLIQEKTEPPPCLELGTTFYAISASNSSNWLVHSNLDHKQNPEQTPTFDSYFESRSNETSDWLNCSNEKADTYSVTIHYSPLDVYFQERSEEISDWLVGEKEGSQVATDTFSNWLHKYDNTDSKTDPEAETSEKYWLISEKTEVQDNKNYVEEVSQWLKNISISATEHETQNKQDPWLSKTTSEVIDPIINSIDLFPCFNEEMDMKIWLVA